MSHMKRLISALILASLAATLAVASAAPLPRANIVLSSAIAVDLVANTVTLPLHKGSARGGTVWYIITDASDAASASKLGVLYSPLLASAGPAIATAGGTIGKLSYQGTVDFSPTRILKTDADGNPTDAHPGSVGDPDYSPLVRIGAGGPVYNAPIVASGDAPHDIDGHTDVLDRVVAINTKNADAATVTLVLARGFTNGQPIAYISTDASVDAPATIERSTYAPKLKTITGGTIPIDVFFNGTKQGVPFAALHGNLGVDASASNAAQLGSPLNVQATFPAPNNAASGYTPLWGVYPAVWTKEATAAGKEQVLKSESEFQNAADAKSITTPDGKPFGPPAITVNCPVVAFAEKRP
jgi:hypothetical protein